ncbi:ras-domain-containing protein [Dendrothele bispora CBS 962.96]|uniref:Ras-domain-containing protein n=1 Tax=Dendrothele bispora (strain CBS 962.96) TaxID=1314807 RepID=A0A4S8M9B7_DENBC|nr:ras-domain-containing protein [Dendrothele bispora CBS 962.96]
MHTVKLVVIGASGVGKTSLRGQYISGRFSTGYRATIGADFITKVLQHPTKQGETVTLQIWDTAGQERFSSLSSAFFRGADAAILMFDVNTPETMEALTKWWEQFKTHAPLSDEEMGDFCCVVVGNKLDLTQKGSQIGNGSAIGINGHVNGLKKKPISRQEAETLLKELIPPEFITPVSMPAVVLPPEQGEVLLAEELEAVSEHDEDPMSASQLTARPRSPDSFHQDSNHITVPKSDSIAINNSSLNPLNLRPRRQSQSNTNSPSSPSFSRAAMITRSKSQTNSSRSRSANSRVYSGVGGVGGTMTTMNSGFSIYHTPSSSVYDQFESARTSPEPWPEQSSSISSSPASASGSGSSGSRPPRRRILSAGNRSTLSIDSLQTRSTSSVATVTPSLYAREHDEDNDDWDHEATIASSAASFFSALSGSFSNRSTAPDSSRDTDRTTGGGKFKHSPLRLQIQSNSFTPPTLSKPPTPLPTVPPPITPPDCGPRLFMTSAKTGEGVKDVFEYIAKRVVTRWEWEERQEAARFEFGEGGGDGTWSSRYRGRGGSWGRKTGQGIKLGARTESGRGRGRGGMVNGNGSWSASCCST